MPQNQRKYQSVEDIEREFESRIRAEEDPVAKADLRVELAQAKIDFRGQEAQDRMKDAWRRLAMTEFPQAAKFPELLHGETEEEIRISAKEVSDRLESLMKQTATADSFSQVRDFAQNYSYGRGTGSGGIGPDSRPPTSYTPPDRGEERWRMEFAQKFNDSPRDAYGSRIGVNPNDVDRYVRGRAVEHIADKVRFWGQLTRSDFRG